MSTTDWDDFSHHAVWVVNKFSAVEVQETRSAAAGVFNPSPAFIKAYPVLTQLLSRARVTPIVAGQVAYLLYGWTGQDERSLGWLSPTLDAPLMKNQLHSDHRLLLRFFGGVEAQWNEPVDENWLLNLNWAPCEKDCEIGFGEGIEDYYLDLCEQEEIEPSLDVNQYISFAVEANSNTTAYHRRTSEVVMFAHDHCFDYLTPLASCPDYSFYTLNNCPDFRSWVENVAGQWLRVVQP